MFNIITKAIEWGGQTLTLETGKIARQADGCVMATLGETCVMAAVTFDKKQNSELDFFPLTVNYQEKYYSSGKIPGGFFKREAKPSDASTLISRLIDRPIRPLFPEGFKNPVDIVCSVLSHDLENDPDILAMVASSAALAISGAPFLGPIGATRIGFANGEFILNPSISEIEQMGNGQKLDLVVAGTSEAVMMVESIAYELTEEEMLGAVVFGHENMQPVIDMINELKNEVNKPQYEFIPAETDELNEKVTSIGQGLIADAYEISQKAERQDAISQAKEKIKSELEEEYSEREISGQIKKLESGILRNNILENGRRIDNRSLTQVRPIECEVGLFSRPHGSALFTRGETQALVMTTLGTGDDEQIVDALHGNFRENFLLHYNFPPYSVGETGRLGPPGRREIGHGKLAWRALKPVLPEPDQFPYTIRVVSEITESNGSSSMA
ncbi:MAG: polyribonucleotide nucleotidyltransferase, partial [Rhodobacteraceae bacterium]|nr:polyribonucleotide nucleotidyltransferase [Paracoccaceae bacterium]